MLSKHCNHSSISSDEFGTLDAHECNIRIIDRLNESICFVTVLNLSHNHLLSLSGIEQFHNLQCFQFDFNHISLPNEFSKIKNPFFMKSISFKANPIELIRNIDIYWLRNHGFSRLIYCNQNYSQFTMHYTPTNKQQVQYFKNQTKYEDSAEKTKRMVGRITHKEHTTNSKELKQHLQTRNTQDTQLKQRQIQRQKQQHHYVSSFKTHLQQESNNVFDQNICNALSNIEEKKDQLAKFFRERVLIEKTYRILKQYIGRKEDSLLHRLELSRWAWMKIKIGNRRKQYV